MVNQNKPGSVRKIVFDRLLVNGETSSRDLMDNCGLDSKQASNVLMHLFNDKLLRRSGTSGKYIYKLTAAGEARANGTPKERKKPGKAKRPYKKRGSTTPAQVVEAKPESYPTVLEAMPQNKNMSAASENAITAVGGMISEIETLKAENARLKHVLKQIITAASNSM